MQKGPDEDAEGEDGDFHDKIVDLPFKERLKLTWGCSSEQKEIRASMSLSR